MQTPKARFAHLVDAGVLDSMKSSIVDVSDGRYMPPYVRNFGKIVDWIVDGIMMYNNQDVEADTSVQKGLRSRFAPRGRFSWKETTVAQLNRWLHKRYSEYAESVGLAAR